jgi:hypothetical protein
VFDDIDSEDSQDDENTMDERLGNDGDKSNANSNPYSCNTKFSAAGNQVVASARHVSVSLAREAKLALDSPNACVSFFCGFLP